MELEQKVDEEARLQLAMSIRWGSRSNAAVSKFAEPVGHADLVAGWARTNSWERRGRTWG